MSSSDQLKLPYPLTSTGDFDIYILIAASAATLLDDELSFELAEQTAYRIGAAPRGNKPSSRPPESTVVQIKRKRTDEPIESLWLEVTTKTKRAHTLGIQDLSLDTTTVAADEPTPTKLLFRRVESFSPSGVKELSLPKLLEKSKERKRPRDVTDNNHQSNRIKDQDITKTARFEQVRTSRRRKVSTEENDAAQELFNLYEVVRVDVEAESAQKAARREKAKREAELTEGQLLCNYLPLLREHLPELAAEIDATAKASSSANTSTGMSYQHPF
ncbi:hypothetical protein R1sor_011121 [Riccia sorocarpa]|uniref:Uncharacterized protein n=1 Tax=Riccia sorocarpa TaxID=122646 RepID=A0ABD3I3L8_9MARC